MSETKNVQDAVHEPGQSGKSGKKYAGKTVLLILLAAAIGAYFVWPPYKSIIDSIFAAFATGDFAAVRSFVERYGTMAAAAACFYIARILGRDVGLGYEAMKKRAAESPCGTVVSYCASCRSAMRTGGRESLHLLDLVFGGDWTGRPTPPPDRSLRSWLNRWRTKQLLGKVPHRSARDDLAVS